MVLILRWSSLIMILVDTCYLNDPDMTERVNENWIS